MPKKYEKTKEGSIKPFASISIKFFDTETLVEIGNFERLSPRKIQRCLGNVYKEWNRQRAQAILVLRQKSQVEEAAAMKTPQEEREVVNG